MGFITTRGPLRIARDEADEDARLAQDHWRAGAGDAGPVQISGTGSAYDIATLENSGAASVAFSPGESRIYVSRYDGKLDVFDADTLVKLATWTVGTSLGGLSVSESGDFLLVVERFREPGPWSPPGPTPTSTFYQVDTQTGAVTTFTRAGGAYLDVEIVDGQRAILTGGQQDVTVFSLTDHSYMTLPGAVYYSNNSIIVEDEHYTLFAESGISSGPLMIYDDRTGTIVAKGNNYQTLDATSGQTGFNFGHQAISEAGGLVAQFIYHSTVNLFDLNLKFLYGIEITGPIDGLAFDITGKFLYAHSGNQLNLIDVSNGAVVESFVVATASWHNNFGSGDQIVLSEDGKSILVKDNTTGTLQVIDLHLRDERFEGTLGADSFAGGKGDDTYVINHAGDAITELRYDGVDLAIVSFDYTLGLYVENLRLTGDAARGTGNELDNHIEGTAGANLLEGLAGNDWLDGGDGEDILDGGAGKDWMAGGAGNDIYYVDAATDVVSEAAGQGFDAVYASASHALAAGSEVEWLSTRDNTATVAIALTGNEIANYLIGNQGANVLDGRGGADFMQGFGGDDTYYVDHADDVIVEVAGQGFDTVYTSISFALAADADIEWLSTAATASMAAINLTGNALGQYLLGNAGANILNGAGGADVMIGYGGDDLYFVDNAGDAVIEAAGAGSDTIRASVSYYLSAGVSVETLATLSQASLSDLRLTGNELAQTIQGNNGFNTLNGNGGGDVMIGYGGSDSYYVKSTADQVVEAAGEGFDAVYAAVDYTLTAGVEVEWFSTIDNAATAALNLTGNAIGQYLVGNAGANILDGGGGADLMYGLGGNDIYLVDNAGDVPFENADGGFDTVRTSVTYLLSSGIHVERIEIADAAGTGAIDLIGNELAQELIGNAGGNGLNGAGGADVMRGLGGNDTYYVDNGGDQAIEAVGQGFDAVYTEVSYSLAAGSEVEWLAAANAGASAALNLTGNEFVNYVLGNNGANILDGGAGADIMTGYGGPDTFAFTTALGATNVDTIMDFVAGTDKIALDDAVFTALVPGALAAGAFVTGTAALDASDRIVYNSATGQLFYDADGNGAGAAVLFATLQGNPALAASDFVVI